MRLYSIASPQFGVRVCLLNYIIPKHCYLNHPSWNFSSYCLHFIRTFIIHTTLSLIWASFIQFSWLRTMRLKHLILLVHVDSDYIHNRPQIHPYHHHHSGLLMQIYPMGRIVGWCHSLQLEIYPNSYFWIIIINFDCIIFIITKVHPLQIVVLKDRLLSFFHPWIKWIILKNIIQIDWIEAWIDFFLTSPFACVFFNFIL